MKRNNFSILPLSKPMLQILKDIGYDTMTPIQEKSLPHIIKGKDVIAQAKTGSGKTAAFAIGLLNNITVDSTTVQALVLCPTRELADQVSKEIRRIARFAGNIKVLTLCGGAPYGPQQESLGHGAHVIVGTPGRVLGHLDFGALKLDGLKTLVLDEAHRMLDMGFMDSIKKVVKFAPKKRQTLLFSATYPEEILKLSSKIQVNAVDLQTDNSDNVKEIIEVFYAAAADKKIEAIARLLAHYKPDTALVFTNTKQDCKEIAENLLKQKIDAIAMHGDLEQYERTDVLVRFANKSCSVMVATDLAARGLDIAELPMVINHEVPPDKSTYTHRIGRTGRAGVSGMAITLYCERQEFRAKGYKDDVRIFDHINSLNKIGKFSLKPTNTTVVLEAG